MFCERNKNDHCKVNDIGDKLFSPDYLKSDRKKGRYFKEMELKTSVSLVK